MGDSWTDAGRKRDCGLCADVCGNYFSAASFKDSEELQTIIDFTFGVFYAIMYGEIETGAKTYEKSSFKIKWRSPCRR